MIEKQGLVLNERGRPQLGLRDDLRQIEPLDHDPYALLPNELVSLLASLINATLHNLIPPDATSRLIKLAKQHLNDGIWLGDQYYQVMVYTPDDKEHGRRLFTMVKAYPGGKLAFLRETEE